MKRALRRVLFAEREQRAAVQRVRRRQLRIELHGALELALGRRIVLLAEVRDAHEQVRFGRLAGAEDAVDVLLPLGDVARRAAAPCRAG